MSLFVKRVFFYAALWGGMGLSPFSPGLFAQSIDAGSMDAGLLRELEQAPPDAYHEVFVLMKDRVSLESFVSSDLRARMPSPGRVSEMLQALERKARTTQEPLQNWLRAQPGVDQEQLVSFWITNMLFVRATRAVIADLSQRPEVAWIEKNEELEVERTQAVASAPFVLPNGREPGLTTMNAPGMWALGYTGYGRKILIVDSGQDAEHPALRNQFAYNYAPQTSTYLSTALSDYCDSHGTGVASAAVGMDPLTKDTIGVAFNAKWMGAPFSNLRSIDSGDFCEYKGTVRDVSYVLQWALNPDGNISTTSDMPDVINNSYGRKLSSTVECSQVWPELFRALDAVGIAVVFAAGNDGPSASSVNLQAAISINDVTPFSVGAVNGNSGVMADFSGRGPSLCSNLLNPGYDIKPEVSAPGVNVRVATTGRIAYEYVNGTSFAAPYVAGAILLLKEAFPGLPGRELARALYHSAKDLGAPGEDNDSGKGLIDILAAYQYLVSKGNTPTPPTPSVADVANLHSSPRLLNCGGRVYLEVTFRNEGTEVLRSVDIEIRREFSSTPIFSTTWTGNLVPGATASYMVPEFPSGFGGYTIEVELKRPNGKTDDRPLNNQLKRKAVVTPQPMLPPVALASATICAGGRNLITSTYTGNGTLRWYNKVDGGTALAQGLSFYTGPLLTDTTLYAELRFLEKAGKSDNTGGVTALADSTTGGLLFDCYAPFTLKSVLVYVAAAGPRNIRLRRPDGSIQQRLVNVPKVGANRITLDFSIEPGEGYMIDYSVGKELYVSKSGTSFPYTIPSVLSIHSSASVDASVYSYYYDWEVEYNYPCGRLPVRIPVDEMTTGVKADFTAPDSVLLSNGVANVLFENKSVAATQFTWNLGDGNTSAAVNPTHTYDKPGKYLIILSASTSSTCSDVAFKTIGVTTVTSLKSIAEMGGNLQIAPNPTNGQTWLHLELPEPDEVRLFVVDMLGRKLQYRTFGKTASLQTILDLSALPAGPYQLLFYGNSFRHTQALIVQP